MMIRPYAVWLALSLFVAVDCHSTERGIRVALSTHGERVDLYAESYALVVGNGAYGPGWDPIPGAPKDAAEVARALQKIGFRVILKTNLTKEQFESVFRRFCINYGQNPDSRLLFYYAGHGYTQKMQTDEDLGFLVMVDTPSPDTDMGGFSMKSVDMVSLVTQAKLVRSRHVMYMFDSCFSGSILNLRDGITPRRITENVSLPVRQFITAGRANEPVPDQSKFKTVFLDLIEGRDEEPFKDGVITGEELGYYLKYKVPQYNPSQHPQYGKIRDPKLDKGDFVFTIKKGATIKPVQASDAAPPVAHVLYPDTYTARQPRRWSKKMAWGPRIGASGSGTGLLGVEIQYRHLAIASGFIPTSGGIVGVKYYFSSPGHSWFLALSGAAIANETDEFGGMTETEETTYFGAMIGYRWLWSSGFNLSLGIGGGPFEQTYSYSGQEGYLTDSWGRERVYNGYSSMLTSEDKNGTTPMIDVSIGYSF